MAKKQTATAGTTKQRRKRRTKAEINALKELCRDLAADRRPTTVRGLAYALFELGAIDSMHLNETKSLSKYLVEAREEELIPWDWLVDESRSEIDFGFLGDASPASYAHDLLRSNLYRVNPWDSQPRRVELWSEKATVGGVVSPVMEQWHLKLKNMKGFVSATHLHHSAQESVSSDKPLILLYLWDFDISGVFMFERDLPDRLARYGGEAALVRVALGPNDVGGWQGHPVDLTDENPNSHLSHWKKMDYGDTSWELDGLNPNELRSKLDAAIQQVVDLDLWQKSLDREPVERAEVDQFLAHMRDAARVYFGNDELFSD